MRIAEGTALGIGLVAAIVRHGLGEVTSTLAWELGATVVLCLLVLLGGQIALLSWSTDRTLHTRRHAFVLGLLSLWVLGVAILPNLVEFPGNVTTAGDVFRLSEIVVGLVGVLYGIGLTRRVAAGGRNPGFLLAASFVLLIGTGTILLMLPGARRHETSDVNTSAENDVADSVEHEHRNGAPFRVAFFTATSASCVTGLIVVPTGSYWSMFGQIVILCLFQIGGLGIMTCGAFFAAAMGSRFAFRETATLGNLLDTESARGLRTLLRTILVATFATEVLGGLVLTTLWPHLPWGERLFYGFFHSVSAFCNAGFSLRDVGFDGWGTRWQVALVVPFLIVAGGLGFAVTYNVWLWTKTRIRGSAPHSTPLFHFPGERVKLTLGSKIVLVTTGVLLVVGTLGYYSLEALAEESASESFGKRWCDAWFQSVTFRTAGFNTVDHGTLQPGTKLFAILLMFIGASPGSTGGGIKTVSIAIAVLAIASAFRGHDRVEIANRTIPPRQVTRALTIIALGLATLVSTTMLLLIFEGTPAVDHGPRHEFLDLLYEAASATATVGVSTGVTADLVPASQYVLVLAMFLGRVGPLTLLLALAGGNADVRYKYPEEAVSLG